MCNSLNNQMSLWTNVANSSLSSTNPILGLTNGGAKVEDFKHLSSPIASKTDVIWRISR